jgi:hypothetical protein
MIGPASGRPPDLVITREGDPPPYEDGVWRCNGYAFISMRAWREGRKFPSVGLRPDPDFEWDSEEFPGGYFVRCHIGLPGDDLDHPDGYAVFPIEMVTEGEE